jgi:plastocyanin
MAKILNVKINGANYYYVTADSLNIRKGPATSYNIIGKLYKRAIIKARNVANGWIQIVYNGKPGYVSSEYCAQITRTNTALNHLSLYGESYLGALDVSRVPNLVDAVVNGIKDDSSPEYDVFKSDKGELRVDKETRLVTGEPVDVPLPEILSQPADTAAGPGDTAAFTVSVAGGEGPFAFNWYSRADASGDWQRVKAFAPQPGETSDTLEVTASEELDGAQYYCVIQDRYFNAIVSDVAELTVTEDFAIVMQPADRTVAPGQTVQFTARAGMGAAPYTYQWYYRTSPAGSWTPVSAASGKTAKYSLAAEARHNGYQYK